MTPLSVALYARLGNAMHGYAYARKLSEHTGRELRVAPWIGESIFTLDGVTHARPDGSEEVLRGYFQSQKDLIYTRADCRRWFTLRPEVARILDADPEMQPKGITAHFRRGDYAEAGYPLVSRLSVIAAVAKYFPGPTPEIEDVSDEHPVKHPAFRGDLEMLTDFYRLMRAPILFRANSTFSWWAATLGTGRVFAPVITGLKGGEEHYTVPYIEGNWPKCADGLDFVTDLHLKEA